jgi:hypothetical protein
MFRATFSFLSYHPARKAQASDSGTKPGSPAAQAATEDGASSSGPSSGPALQRSGSVPSRLPSDLLEPAEVKKARKAITRPSRDTRSGEEFKVREDEGGMLEGARRKRNYLDWVLSKSRNTYELVAKIERSEEHMHLMESVHPQYREYGQDQKIKACYAMTFSHPLLLAEEAKKRNELYGIPNQPVSTRTMEPNEEKFLANAIQRINEDVEKKQFHLHGGVCLK